jgi:hypothetical protein
VSKRGYTTLLLAACLLLIGIAALGTIICLSAPPASLSLSKLETEAQQGAISDVVITGRQILATQRDVMDRVVARLKEVETVSARELDDMVATTNPLAVSAG